MPKLDVYRSGAGYYIGTYCQCGLYTRESGYYRTRELGDARRLSSSRQAVRFAGLDITVHESDVRRSGHLSRQGSAVLRWAVFEAAQCAARAPR